MKTYASIKAEIAKLEKQAEQARKAEVAGVVARIKQAIDAYGLTADDLGFAGSASSRVKPSRESRSTARPRTGIARYRDPASGKTWTGQGRPPAWIADATDREAFLIGSVSTSNRMARKSKTGRKVGASKGIPTTKKARGRKTAASPAKTASVQIESGAASE